MCCVLVDQHEPVRIFHQNVKLVQDTDDVELVLIAIAFGWSAPWSLIRLNSLAAVNASGYSSSS